MTSELQDPIQNPEEHATWIIKTTKQEQQYPIPNVDWRGLHSDVWQFHAEAPPPWSVPDQEDALRFVLTEVGESLDAWLRTRPEFSRNNKKSLSVADELADVAFMLLTAFGPQWSLDIGDQSFNDNIAKFARWHWGKSSERTDGDRLNRIAVCAFKVFHWFLISRERIVFAREAESRRAAGIEYLLNRAAAYDASDTTPILEALNNISDTPEEIAKLWDEAQNASQVYLDNMFMALVGIALYPGMIDLRGRVDARLDRIRTRLGGRIIPLSIQDGQVFVSPEGMRMV
jgi:hypothetical protein